MKLGKLYIKIALSFLVLFFIALMFIFSLFLISPGKHFTTRLQENNKAVALIVKNALEDKINGEANRKLLEKEPLNDLIYNFAQILGAQIWLNYPDGSLAVKSFSDEIPLIDSFQKWFKSADYGSYKLYHNEYSGFYAVMPIVFPEKGTGKLHILVKKRGHPSPGRGFAFGLFVIGLVFALLIIPISRFVIKPLKSLNESALLIADGDLSHRPSFDSKDEIGQLCRSFNYMADKLENMIISGKELTANVSHELRTPLTRMRVAEEMLRDRLGQGKFSDWTRHLDEIREDISELDIIIGRILELSKLDIQESPLKLEQFDLQALMNDILAKFQPVIDQKTLHVSQGPAFEPSFKGDREALGTALLNILDNAIKFTTEKGDILIKIRSERDILIISVINTYDPLPDDELAKIFDPFHRAKQAKAVGSGLGLAITKKIVERHEGSIEALNSDKGLEIRISLPIV